MTKTNQKIPDGWSVKKLGEIFFKSQKKHIEAKNIPVLTNSAVKGVIPQNEYFDREIISEENLCNYYYVECGDFIYNPRISKTAPAGPIKRNHFTKPGCVSPLYTVFKIASNVSEEFYENYFESNLWAYEAYKVANYGARSDRMNITDRDFFNIKLPFPPLAEQEKIAEILSCWDEGIEKLSALIEKKKIQKKALMQQLLTGKHRIKGFATPWHKVKLGDIGIISSAGVDKKIIEGEKFVYLLNYMDVYKKNFLYTCDASMVVSANARQIIKCNLKKGDIFFTPSSETRDDIAHSAVVMEDIINGVYSYHIIRLRPTTHIDLKFTAYAFKTNLFYKQAFSICEGSGQRYVISQDYFRNMTVFIPSSLAEQKAIADILSKADEEIELLNKKLEAFKLEKKALMQKLLTGKIRVKVN